MQKVALLIIDGQNDFVLSTGALPVPGAVEDMNRVVNFIGKNIDKIGNITCTLDSHRPLDIAHVAWWRNKDGSPIGVHTPISTQDLKSGLYYPIISVKWSIAYVDTLEKQGEYGHYIWPDHCIIATPGAALYEPLSNAVCNWSKKVMIPVTYVTKGDNPYTEHFGAFRANVEIAADPTTQFNQRLISQLSAFDQVYIAGEAKSHCVANSVSQLVKEVPAFLSKVTFLEDCMSDIVGVGLPQSFYDREAQIYSDAVAAGAQFKKSTDVIL